MKNQKGLPAGRQGFTLVELLVVVAIISLLAVAVIVAVNPAQKLRDTKTAQAKRDVKVAAEAIERCITDYLITYSSATEATAIGNCDSVGELKISTLATGQAVNSNAGTTSVCFSSLTGSSGVYVKYIHNTSGTSYVEDAAAACAAGV